MIREFFYLQKSDRKVILTLLLVIVVLEDSLSDKGYTTDCQHLSAGGTAVYERDASDVYVVCPPFLGKGVHGRSGTD